MLNKYSHNDIKCKYCGIRDEKCLTFHHVHGGGMKEQRDIGYRSLVEYLYHNDIPLTDIEVVCQNCNKSMGHYGYLPF
jgi:5-methylcytosine-specific restriction endonuclease McrA